jgi:purine-binding chemotaxis protein CheW
MKSKNTQDQKRFNAQIQKIKNREGKYLTFVLGKEEYGLEILKVREVIAYTDITLIPKTPSYIKGVVNLRGQVIPVVELRVRFGMEPTEVNDQTAILIVKTTQKGRETDIGLIVDRMEKVLEIGYADIEDVPPFGVGVDVTYVLGLGKVNESVMMLLDIDKILSGDELDSITKTD